MYFNITFDKIKTSIYSLYYHFNKTASRMKFTIKVEPYIAKSNRDDLNPKYLFQGIAPDLLVAIVKQQINPMDENGNWVGFVK